MTWAMCKYSEYDRSDGFSMLVKYALISSELDTFVVDSLSLLFFNLDSSCHIHHNKITQMNYLQMFQEVVTIWLALQELFILPNGWTCKLS